MIAFRRAGIALTAAIAAFFIIAPVHSFLVHGFSWHIRQSAAWQGGAEVLALVGVFYVAQTLKDARLRLLAFALPAWLFARRHGVDISIALVYLYAEGIFAIGWCLLPRIGFHQSQRLSTVLVGALVGVVAWSLVIWVSSALGFGSLVAIHFIAIAVLGLALTMSRGPRIASIATRSMCFNGRMDRLAIAAFTAFFLALFAKASVVIDYDSVWYGLQADEVLVGDGSLYVAQGLVSYVHYYPKLYEALQLPFSGIGSVSLVYGTSILGWVLVVVTVQAILREFRIRRTLSLWGTAAIATLPALANIAVTAKGDAFSAWLTLMSVLGLIRYRKQLGDQWLWVAVSGAVLAVQARLSNIPYAAILLVVLGWTFLRRWRINRWATMDLTRGIRLGIATAVLSGLITARSLLLAGVALIAPYSIFRLQQVLGLQLKYPIGAPPTEDGLARLPMMDGLWKILFDPAQYPHLVITWTGNVWLFLPIAGVLLGAKCARGESGRDAWLLLLLGLSFFALMFGYPQLVPASDGNYFIVPLACLAMWGVIQADRVPADRRVHLELILVMFAIATAAISFVTGSWGPGTRGFDRVMTRLPFEYAAHAMQGLAGAHLRGVARYFSGMPAGTRVVGLETPDTDAGYPAGSWLGVRYEPLLPFTWQQPELVATSEAFERYLYAARIAYVVTPKQKRPDTIDSVVRSSLDDMGVAKKAEVAYEDEYWTVWKLKFDPTSTVQLSAGGTAKVALDSKLLCDQRRDIVATVSWIDASSNVAIEVGSNGRTALWAEAGASGSLQTGPWVSFGTEFTFKRGTHGDVLGRITLAPQCDP